jgi:hypothetical protein
MGFEVTNHVWEHSSAQGTAKLLLLALARRAHNDTWECWPSREELARNIGRDVRTVQRLTGELVALGELEVSCQDGPVPLKGFNAGRPDRKTNRYHVLVSPDDRTPASSREDERGDVDVTPLPLDWVTFLSERGDRNGRYGVTPMSRELVTESVTESVTSRAPSALRARAPRKGDELFDALAVSCGIEVAGITRSERGRLNKALKDLREVGATPAEISVRAARYRRTWPKVSITASALAAHWGELASDGPGPVDTLASAVEAAKRAGR